jgi:hypothetical protein
LKFLNVIFILGTDWALCIICQTSTSEDLRCPKDRKHSDFLLVYNTFLKNIKLFKELKSDHLPAGFIYDKTADYLSEKSASWHHSCHVKFAESKLERLVKKRKKEQTNEVEVVRKCRRSENTIVEKCLFCKATSKESLHSCSTVNADRNIRKMATELNDTELIGYLSGK